jgi:MoxR-like ATPase
MEFKNDVEALDALRNKFEELKNEITKVIYGQDEVITQVLVSLFSRGHVLLIGVPGLAKTLLVTTIAKILDLKYNRIQFTPDLMPSDIIGTEILDQDRHFKFIKGPLFANIILADEINRTPPKTQSALLEAMQERAITAAGQRFELDNPFFVLATQNPIEQEGTYPLPEAQLDRFMFSVWLDYPKYEDEITIVKNTTSNLQFNLKPVITAREILFFRI